jgi:hypothetical protein
VEMQENSFIGRGNTTEKFEDLSNKLALNMDRI